ncbi:helix-turn-helix domain-containing protein [Bacillus sp. 31A1R]|uniref:Helix-turn-helix domain-containing protein n=2 Tax=Robertmurraya mangrovi TaxID=3098077 RepID=A0ABU5J1I2_9BACI|nr:helix-turn-helix domain-containing protein [Bacillus sp. 31A1R]MDZ5473258.1 helix-turn-helix domain-containing protein [Bacillus sp. 31A1R]
MFLQDEMQNVGIATKMVEDKLPRVFETLQKEQLISIYKSLANVQTALSSIYNSTHFTYRDSIEKLSKEEMEQVVSALVLQLIESGSRTDLLSNYIETRLYRTKEFADAMGVTQATISNWIKEGRLIGVEKKAKGSHVMIPETATYFNITNQRFSVKEIMESYNQMLVKRAELPEENSIDEYNRINARFIEKYKGTYFETLGTLEALDDEQERDAAEWEYVLDELGQFNDE